MLSRTVRRGPSEGSTTLTYQVGLLKQANQPTEGPKMAGPPKPAGPTQQAASSVRWVPFHHQFAEFQPWFTSISTAQFCSLTSIMEPHGAAHTITSIHTASAVFHVINLCSHFVSMWHVQLVIQAFMLAFVIVNKMCTVHWTNLLSLVFSMNAFMYTLPAYTSAQQHTN